MADALSRKDQPEVEDVSVSAITHSTVTISDQFRQQIQDGHFKDRFRQDGLKTAPIHKDCLIRDGLKLLQN